jgi:hypothetical protein
LAQECCYEARDASGPEIGHYRSASSRRGHSAQHPPPPQPTLSTKPIIVSVRTTSKAAATRHTLIGACIQQRRSSMAACMCQSCTRRVHAPHMCTLDGSIGTWARPSTSCIYKHPQGQAICQSCWLERGLSPTPKYQEHQPDPKHHHHAATVHHHCIHPDRQQPLTGWCHTPVPTAPQPESSRSSVNKKYEYLAYPRSFHASSTHIT